MKVRELRMREMGEEKWGIQMAKYMKEIGKMMLGMVLESFTLLNQK